jgi:hypothetical protein
MKILLMLLRKNIYIQKVSSSSLGLATGHLEGHDRLSSYACFPPINHQIFIIFYFSLWDETESIWYCSQSWSIVPAPDVKWFCEWNNWWNEDWQGKPKYSVKAYSRAILCTTNPTWPDPGLNLGRRSGKPATDLLSYGTSVSVFK